MNRLNRTKQAQVIAALVEGNSIRATERMTGVADPYEPPPEPEIRLETMDRTADQNAAAVVDYLDGHGYLD